MEQASDKHIGKIRIGEELELEGKVWHREIDQHVVTESISVDINESGLTFFIQDDALVCTLPATGYGKTYTFINDMDDGDCLVTITPGAGDKIIGIGYTGVDVGTLTNTKATAKYGDYVVIVGDGSLGWYVQECCGIWVIAEA